MGDPNPILICVAVELEAQAFRQLQSRLAGTRLFVTGMGPVKVRRTLAAHLKQEQPRLVISCGLAGALNPRLNVGEVVYDIDSHPDFAARLQNAGAQPARFCGAEQVIVTTAAKQALREATGADAVDMESRVIHSLCQEHGLAHATVRIISDTAQENLPLDFNQFLTADQQVAPSKIAWHVLWHPGTLRALVRFQRQCRLCARSLARFMIRVFELNPPQVS